MTRLVKRTAVAMLLVLFLCLLALNGFVTGKFGGDSEADPLTGHQAVPKSIITGGPIIANDPNSVRPVAVPDKTIVLSFNDGPDPVWTPKLLSVLRANGVRATFFMTGSKVALHPGLVRQVQRDGNEIGLYSFSRGNLTKQSTNRVNLELTESQIALAGATGLTTPLFRPPYTASPSALDNNSWPVVDRLATRGYVVVMSSLDVLKTPAENSGGIIAMNSHNETGAQTVAAVETLVPELKQRGYKFATVAQVLGQPTDNAATHAEVTRGRVLLAAVYLSRVVSNTFTGLLFVTGILVTARLLIMLVVARRHAAIRRKPDWSWGDTVTDPVSVIVPAYNEGVCIADTINSLLANNHPIEIIVVDDGSTDDTAAIAERIGAGNVRVVRKPNGGKASALNLGIALASHELVVMMDGDTVFEPDAVARLVQPFADPSVGAVAGNAKVANRHGLLGRWQHIEYVTGFSIDRRVYDLWQCMPTIAGAIGAFRRNVLLEVGGLSNATLAEDTDLTMSICRAGWRVVYEDSAQAQTEAPSNLRGIWRQRYRWSYGTMQSMWKHRRAIIERGSSGRFGRRGLFNLALFQVLLPITSPLVDVFLVYGLIFLNPVLTVSAWLGMLAMQTLSSAIAFHLDRERFRTLWVLPLQQFLYRQLMYFVLLQSVLSALGGIRMGWQKLARTGGLGALLESQHDSAPAEAM